MDLPQLPPEFDFVSAVPNEEQLLAALLERPQDQLVRFIEAASEDETWCTQQAPLLQKLLNQLTTSFARRRLPEDDAQRVVETIWAHKRVLLPLMVKDVTLDVRGKKFQVNRLLFGQASRYWKSALEKGFWPDERPRLDVGPVPIRVFKLVEEYIESGRAEQLRIESKAELMEDLLQAVVWDMDGLRALCIAEIERYISLDNLPQFLAVAQQYQLSDLKLVCCAVWNRQVSGASLESATSNELALIVREFLNPERPYLNAVSPYITRLGFRADGALDAAAPALLTACHALNAFDLCETNGCHETLFELVPPLSELYVAQCNWLNDLQLVTLVSRFPALRKIDLSANPQISERFCELLTLRHGLEILRLAHCHQLRDPDFYFFLSFWGQELLELDISWCTALTDETVRQIGHVSKKLKRLIASHCLFSDAALDELRRRNPQLEVVS